MNEQVKQLSEKMAMYESQLASQKSETKIARDTLTDALAEMEVCLLFSTAPPFLSL